MLTPAQLKHQISSTQDLQTIVKTMKALAAVNIHQYEQAVLALSDYHETLMMGIHIFLINHRQFLSEFTPTETNQMGIIIFGSDQGMCGQFNEQVANLFEQELKVLSRKPVLLVVGSRLNVALKERYDEPDIFLSVPASIDGITEKVQTIVAKIEQWRQQNSVNQILLFHNSPAANSTYTPMKYQLFPPLGLEYLKRLQQKPWPSRCHPKVFLSSEQLFRALFRQHFFVTLYRVCAESLASENMSRLTSMQVAEKNISAHLMQLQATFQQQRQSIITEELLDMMAGFEALHDQ